MKAAVWHGTRQIRIDDVPSPTVRPDEVLLRVQMVGICGSELSGYLGQNSLRRPPLIMGHEFSGIVAQVGSAVTSLRDGDRVTVNPLIPDGTCAMCRQGRENLCLHRSLIGAHRPGAFAEYVAVPTIACHVLPAALDDATGTLVEPLACAWRAVKLAGVASDDRVLVLGAGPIGLLTLVAARQAGARFVAVSDVNPVRLALAREWGADQTINPQEQDLPDTMKELTEGLGCDSAIDAVGLPGTRQQAVEAVRMGGQVVFVGLHEDRTELAVNHIVRAEITVRGSFAYTRDDFTQALHALTDGVIPGDSRWLTIRPLEDTDRYFTQLIDDPQGLTKVVLRI